MEICMRRWNARKIVCRPRGLFVVLIAGILAGQVAEAAGTSNRDELRLPQSLQPRSLSRVVSEEAAARLSAPLSVLYDVRSAADERQQAAEALRSLVQEEAFQPLRSAILRRVDLVSAGIAASAVEGLTPEQREAIQNIVAAASRYEDTCSEADAETVRAAWLNLRENEAVMTVLRPVFMTHYFNHNMHVTVSEPLLARFVSDYETREGTVAECILGAWVTGTQVTTASVSADIRRSTDQGHFILRLNGKTLSNTRGRRRPATIYTRGTHTFQIDAPVYFDGRTLTSGPARMDVNTHNQTVGVRSDYDGVPLLGPLVRKMARKKAAEKRPQSEYIAAQKIARQALPEFVDQVNERFAEANRSIQEELFDGLNRKGVGPDSLSCRSSESHLAISSRTIGGARLGGTVQPIAPLPAGVAIQLHQTAINNLIDGLEMNGREIPEDQFFEQVGQAFRDLLQRDISLFSGDDEDAAEEKEGDDPPATFLLNDIDPIRIRVEDDVLVLILQAGVVQEGRDPIPQHRIEVPIGIGVEDGSIVLTPPERLSEIRTVALEKVPALKRASVANQIRRIIRSRLPKRTVDGVVSIQASDTKTIDLQTVELSSRDGWLYIELQ